MLPHAYQVNSCHFPHHKDIDHTLYSIPAGVPRPHCDPGNHQPLLNVITSDPIPKPTLILCNGEILLQHVFWTFGIPEDIVSDLSPQFTSCVQAKFKEMFMVTISLTSGYHPQARWNRSIRRSAGSKAHSVLKTQRIEFSSCLGQSKPKTPVHHSPILSQCVLG